MLLSFSDAVVKLSGARFTLAQLVLLRSLGACVLLILIAVAMREATQSRAPLWVTLRSFGLMAMWFFYYAALPVLPFALAAACLYTAPLWMALLSRLLLGERLGPVRVAAVWLGVLGVCLAVNPFVQPPSPWVLLPLAAAFCYALAAVITWSKCREEGAIAMALNLNVTLAAAASGLLGWLAVSGGNNPGSFVLGLWSPLSAGDWGLLGLLSVLMVVIATAVAGAYRLAPRPRDRTLRQRLSGFCGIVGASCSSTRFRAGWRWPGWR